MLNRSIEIKKEMDYRLQMLSDKKKQIEKLTYEQSIIEKDILNFYKERCNTEICNMVDLHSAWVDQPEPDPNRNYLEQTRSTDFELLMRLILRNIFGKIANEIRFPKKLIINGFGMSSLDVDFSYKNKNFQLNIPNIKYLNTYEEFRWYGAYILSIREGEYTIEHIASYYTSDELCENIEALLNKACEVKADETII